MLDGVKNMAQTLSEREF